MHDSGDWPAGQRSRGIVDLKPTRRYSNQGKHVDGAGHRRLLPVIGDRHIVNRRNGDRADEQ